MKSITCIVLGDGAIFTVDIADHLQVSHLKTMIKEQRKSIIKSNACEMWLYLAKKRGNWLQDDDPDVPVLQKGEVPDGILRIIDNAEETRMCPASNVGNTAYNFPDEYDDDRASEIHVLAAVPGIDFVRPVPIKRPPHPRRLTRWARLNHALDNVHKQIRYVDGEFSMGHSTLMFQDVKSIMPYRTYEQPRKSISDDTINLLYSYLRVATTAFDALGTGIDAKRLHFVAPVLVCVCALFDGDAKLLADVTLVGKHVHAEAKFEFVIKRSSRRVCIVVPKDNDMDQGVVQAYVGSEVLADVEGLSVVYNIVTNYRQWWFSRISDDRVERECADIRFDQNAGIWFDWNLLPTRESVKEIAEKVYAMLADDE